MDIGYQPTPILGWLYTNQSYAQLTWAQEPTTITGNDIEGEVSIVPRAY